MTAFADCSPTEADEAYVIGKRGQYTPVGAYLAGDEIIKIAVEHGAQLVHPGWFLYPFSIYKYCPSIVHLLINFIRLRFLV